LKCFLRASQVLHIVGFGFLLVVCYQGYFELTYELKVS
jgi:hypothetical protein